MGSYAKGEATRAALIDAARELFYEKGYHATRLDQIAERADANPGLIHYYFKTKANIALEIYGEILLGLVDAVRRLFPNTTVLIRRAIELRVLWAAVESDERFALFMRDILAQDIPLSMGEDTWGEYMAEMSTEIGASFSAVQLGLITRCSTAVEGELIRSFVDERGVYEVDDLVDMDIRALLTFFPVLPHDIEKVVFRSCEEAHRVAVSVTPSLMLIVNT